MIPGIVAGGNSGGTPPPDIWVYNPKVVYDPQDLSTLFQDSAATVPVTADGDPVGAWLNLAPGYTDADLIQPSSGLRPTYRTSGGKSWIEGNGSQWMETRANNALAFAVVSIFTAARKDSGSIDYGVLIAHPHDTAHNPPYFRWAQSSMVSGGQTLRIVSGSGSVADILTTSDADIGDDFLLTTGINSMWNGSGQSAGLIRTNKSIRLAGSTANTTSYPNSNKSMLFANASGGECWVGRSYGHILFDVPVTDQTWIDVCEAYLNDRLQVPV